MEKKEKRIARIENDFIFMAHYALSAVEQKIVLYLASGIDPKNNKGFVKQVASIKSIEKTLWGGENTMGNPYGYLHEITTNLLDRKITFPKGTIINGKKIYGGGINWFQSILVTDTDEGIGIEFMFSERMKPFLLELNRYVRINSMEVMDMRGKYAIRMYQIFKAEREKTRNYEKYHSFSTLLYQIPELKAMLGIAGKYKTFDNFRRRVLESIRKEINTYSMEIKIDFKFHKTRRKITGIEFVISDKGNKQTKDKEVKKDYVPTEKDLMKLTYSQENGYNILVEYKVKEGIALRQIINKIKGAEMEGFEDLFIQKSILHFQKWAKQQKTKQQSAATFVVWWTKHKVFDQRKDNTVFYKIAEAVNIEKRAMESERKDNRMIAKNMTSTEFKKWYKSKKKTEKGEQKIQQVFQASIERLAKEKTNP